MRNHWPRWRAIRSSRRSTTGDGARAERAGLADLRAAVLAEATGRTLELGAGTGLERGPLSGRRHRCRAHRARPAHGAATAGEARRRTTPVRVRAVEAGAEALPFAADSFDTVASTLVLCTVDDPARVAAEIARVLRPGGRLLLLEHVRDPGAGGLSGWQDRLRRPWGWFTGGCHPNRDTGATLRAAGFDVSGLEPAELPAAPPIVRPAIRGSATPPTG